MKELLKVRISYFRFHYFFSWGFALLLAAVLVLIGVEPAHLITMGGSTVVIVLFAVLLGVNSDQEKHNRLLVLLPTKLNEIILVEIILLLLLFAGMVVIWFLTYLIQPVGNVTDVIIQISSFCFYLINWIFFFWIWGDLTYVGSFYLKLIFAFLVVFYIITAIIIGIFFGVEMISWVTLYNDYNTKTLPEVISMAVLSVILVITEYKVFIKRKSYLT